MFKTITWLWFIIKTMTCVENDFILFPKHLHWY